MCDLDIDVCLFEGLHIGELAPHHLALGALRRLAHPSLELVICHCSINEATAGAGRLSSAAPRRFLYTALQSVKLFDDIHITCLSAHSGYNKLRYRRQVFVCVPGPSMAADSPNAVAPWTWKRRDLQRSSEKLLHGQSFRLKLFASAVCTTD